ncbi:MAG: ion transporter [Myxococcales bacterium]|nr:ion transporter [Myxococcales bacterium]
MAMESALVRLIRRARGERSLDDAIARRFEADRHALLSRRLTDLKAEELAGIDSRLRDDAEAMAEAIAALRARSDQALADLDWQAVEELRRRAVDLGRDFEEIQNLRRKVHDAHHERQLSDAIAAKLGSPTRRLVYDTFIMILIVIVIGILLYQELNDLPPATIILLDYVDIGACSIFLADFFWRRSLSIDRRWFWRRYWIDFITSIPLPSVHTLRLGRSLRLLRFIRLIRLARLARFIRIVLFFWRGMDKLAAAFDVRMMRRSVSILIVVLIVGGIGIWAVEGHANAEGVETFGESLWWSFTTVVTGGFGDIRNPTTVAGRLLTALLIIAGMVVVGIFTATLTSLLVREGDVSGEILALEERLLGELQRLRGEILGARPDAQPEARPTAQHPDA